MMLNFEEKLDSTENVWSKALKLLLVGIIASVGGLLYQVYVFRAEEPFSTFEAVMFFVGLLFYTPYSATLVSERYENRLLEVLSPRWRKVVATLRLWFYIFIAWLVLVVIRGAFLQQVLKIDPPLFGVFLSFLILALLFSLPVYSIIVYIQCGRFLVSTQVKKKDRKKVADALTALTPVLGFPLILVTYLVLSFSNIQVEPYWIYYIVFFSTYASVFFLFVDFPYSVGLIEKRKQELENLEEEKATLLERLQKINDDKSKTLLRKISFESEIARIDREKQEIKSQSVHPYKGIIPFASLFLGIFGAVFIEFIKNVLQLA